MRECFSFNYLAEYTIIISIVVVILVLFLLL